MRIAGSIVGILAAAVIISTVVWFERYSPWAEKYPDPRISRVGLSEPVSLRKKVEANSKDQPIDQEKPAAGPQSGRPPIADKPPFPKAVVTERTYNFGTVEVGEERKHAFRIENKGEGRLLFTSSLYDHGSPPKQREIPPGGFADIDVSFRLTEPTPLFAKRATIWTNDPKLPDIQFEIDARPVAQVRVEPSDEWKVPAITGNQDGKFTGKIGSDLEGSFRIVSIESTSKFVKADYRPLNANELRQERMQSGYALNVTVNKDIPEGMFQSELKIHTTLKKGETINIRLTALQLR